MGLTGDDNPGDFSVVLTKINFLEARMEDLTGRLAFLEAGQGIVAVAETGEVSAEPFVNMEPAEGLGDWLSKGALLQKMAAVCFILVFALLFRTVTDYGYVNVTVGSLLGLGYVSVLAIVGCVFYITGRQMANVFSICGFLLLFSIVFEGTGRFGAISTGVAYAILFAALVSSSVVAIRYRVAKLLAVSILGVMISSLAIGFPKINFPLSALLFLAANWVVIIASERQVSPKLKWPVTMLTLLLWALWAFKVYMPVSRGEAIPDYVYINWLLPFLVCFGSLYFMTYLRRYFSEDKLTVYDAVIPTFNMLLLFLVGNVILHNYWQTGWLLGLLALMISFGHFAIGWRLSVNDPGRCAAVGGSFLAGTLMLAMGLPVMIGSIAWSVPFWSLAAYGLLRLSGRCDSAVIRVIAYIYQLFTFWLAMMLGVFVIAKTSSPEASLVAAAVLAVIGLLQFRWCRANPPPDSLLTKVDGGDYMAVSLLMVSLAGFYFFFAMAIEMFAVQAMADPLNTIKCARSILINIAAIVLLIFGSKTHNLELVWIAVGLAIVGCIKVFLVDLFGASGLPLILSVLSFGIVALVGSVVMGRWQKPLGDQAA